jgi:DNA-binding transcriptional ArsR family regulator
MISNLRPSIPASGFIFLSNAVFLVRKIREMRQIESIRTDADLIATAAETLRRESDLSWRVETPRSASGSAAPIVHLGIGGFDLAFQGHFKIRPTAALIDELKGRASENTPPLLVSPRLTDRFVELCRNAGVACVDLNGRVWIKRGTVLVDRSPSPDRERVVAAKSEPDLFFGKSSRLARALLSTREAWTQAELAGATGLSRPRLSRLLDALKAQGFVRREGSSRGGKWSVSQADAFIDAWARRDLWSRRVTVHQFSILSPTLDSAAQKLQASLGADGVAFTQWFAATKRHPYTESPVLSAYVPALPSAEVLKTLNAREVSTGGRLWLLRSSDEGVFQFTRTVDGLTLVSDVQIYLDLLQVGQRGPDAAEALRRWEGFNR